MEERNILDKSRRFRFREQKVGQVLLGQMEVQVVDVDLLAETATFLRLHIGQGVTEEGVILRNAEVFGIVLYEGFGIATVERVICSDTNANGEAFSDEQGRLNDVPLQVLAEKLIDQVRIIPVGGELEQRFLKFDAEVIVDLAAQARTYTQKPKPNKIIILNKYVQKRNHSYIS